MNETISSRKLGGLPRLKRFFRKPWSQQKQSIGFRYLRWVPYAFIPLRLPIGAWWFAENDFMGRALLWDGFENAEYNLAGSLVRPGMTILDIGSHKGFYSLLFSRLVGPNGRVLCFEPSRRERSRLNFHLRINSCRNVKVFDFALGEREANAQLYVVDGTETGLNSLRPPNESVKMHQEMVQIRSLDVVLNEERVRQVDFLKIDVEGAELAVFSGATTLLERVPRPIILAEVSDVRSKPWGHTANDVLCFLDRLNFRWFALRPDGQILPIDRQKAFYNDNFLAIPEERSGDVRNFFTLPQSAKSVSSTALG